MTATPTDVAREILDRACRLSAGDSSQVDRLADLYAEQTDVRHPMNPLGDHPLLSREDIRRHFAGALDGSGVDRMEAVDLVIHTTADPEVIVEEFTYLVHVGDTVTRVPNVFVMRIRDGVVVESHDYVHHLGFAQATGHVGDLLGALAS